MLKTYTISRSDIEIVTKARRENHDKQVDKRLRAVILCGEGKENKEIADQLETSSDMVSRWVSKYATGGVKVLLSKPRTGRPTISFEEEVALL